ncbi:MAG TPA: Na+/H+ antiporter [Candidatus Limnocylindrales bacterium]|nr:Na+/H+ antiporter [Candidatus Limnocylindrales bacterium]
MTLSRVAGGSSTGAALDATGGATTQLIEIVLLLLVVSTVLAVVARRFAVPYPVVLVIGGLGLGFLPGLPAIELEPDLVFILFLPPILFAAGYFTSLRALRLKATPIALLAVGLVLFTTVVVAAVAHALVPAMGWPAAFTLGAIVAPPDAVAATTIFQRLGVPRRIIIVLEGESLLNDATALVAYRLAVGVAMGQISFSVVDAGTSFVVAAAGGVAIGLLVGIVVAWLVARIDDEVFSVIVTFLAPVFAYVPADQMGLSGVLATVVAGIWVGLNSPKALSSRVRVSGFASWQILLFLVNGAVFILIGFTLPGALARLGDRTVGDLVFLAVAVSLAAIVARIVWIPTIYVPYLWRRRRTRAPGAAVVPMPEVRHLAIIGWAGMRGVVSLAAALALPIDFPERDLIIFLTFAVILATLVGQGLTLPLLINRLDIDDGAAGAGQEEAFARYVTSDAAAARLDDLAAEWPGHLELIDNLRAQYSHQTRHAVVRQDAESSDEEAEQELVEHRAIRMGALTAEREALLGLRDRGAISDQIFRRVERDLDLEEIRMEA